MPFKHTLNACSALLRSSRLMATCSLMIASGQLMAQQGFYFGIRAGAHVSSLLNSNDQNTGDALNYSNKVGFTGGIGAGYSFDEHMAVDLDILYSSQGQGYSGKAGTYDTGAFIYNLGLMATINKTGISNDYTARTILRCYKIPVLFHYTGDKTKKNYFSVYAGPQFNILGSATYKINDQENGLAPVGHDPVDMYHKLTIDGVLGVGMGFNLSPVLDLQAHLRMDYGFQDIEQKDAQYNYLSFFAKNYYASTRAATHQATAGLMVSLNYKLIDMSKAKKPKTNTGKS